MTIAAILLTLHVFGFFTLESDFSNGVVAGFQGGLLTGLIALMTVYILKYQMALKDERKMKLQYNKENDERMKTIKQKVGGNIVLFYSVVLIFAGIIAGYFNITVFYTLVLTAMFQLNVSGFLKIYLLRRY
jgi:TRAP-type C4-dicarboxylate transport system permease large subunit